ncbi:aminotransferase class V-fold PLP-dependent enzyme [Roseivivax halodurans]|nr:aminotransferase class V-fold PLP-dependent enzyme [Roseivivax halodurans]
MVRHLEAARDRGPIVAASGNECAPRAAAARMIGASREDVGFAPSTSHAWTAVVAHLELSGRRVLVAPHEWGDNVRHLKSLSRRTGMRVEILPELEWRSPDLLAWSDRIDDDVAAIFVPMVTSVQGIRYPVEEIAALPRPAETRLVIDAAQALGQMPVDVQRLSCDALVGTCRKWLRGPRGTALFWRHPGRMGHMDIRDVEPADLNPALLAGVEQAIEEYLSRGGDNIEPWLGPLRRHAMERAAALGLDFFGAVPPRTGTICLAVPTVLADKVRLGLAAEAAIVKWPDHALSEPHAPEVSAGAVPLRLSPHVYNDLSDLDVVFDRIASAIKERSRR